MKKIFVCLITAFMVFTTTAAYADGYYITEQPVTNEAGYDVGETITLSVSVNAKGRIDWFQNGCGSLSFDPYLYSVKANRRSFVMSEEYDGGEVYAVITFSDGTTLESDHVTLRLKTSNSEPTPGPTPAPTSDPTPEPTPTPDPTPMPKDSTPDPEPTPAITPDSDVTPIPSPLVTPVLDADRMPFEDELLTHIGEIEGMLIFGCVVVLCFLAYKFFRMFI